MDRNELLASLGTLTSIRPRTVTPGPRTRLLVEERDDSVRVSLRAGNESVVLNPDGTRTLLDFLGITPTLAKRLTPRVFGEAATDLLQKQGPFQVVTQEGEIVGVYQPKHPAIPVERGLEVLERTARQPLTYQRGLRWASDPVVTVEAVGVEERPVRVGDLVRAGVSVTISPLGVVRPTVAAFASRLVCTNGAVATSGFATWEGGGAGEGDQVWQWYRESVRGAFRAFENVIAEYQRMAAEQLAPAERAQVLEALLRSSTLPPEVRATVEARALAEPPQTSWDVFNHLTWATSHALGDHEGARVARAQIRLARWGAAPAHERACPACHRAMGRGAGTSGPAHSHAAE